MHQWILRSIVNCNIELGLSDAPTSSTTMLTTTAMTDNASNDVAPVLAANVLGTCHFFAQQFASHVREKVQEAAIIICINECGARYLCVCNAYFGERSGGGSWWHLATWVIM
jgi:hypothetical protein